MHLQQIIYIFIINAFQLFINNICIDVHSTTTFLEFNSLAQTVMEKKKVYRDSREGE